PPETSLHARRQTKERKSSCMNCNRSFDAASRRLPEHHMLSNDGTDDDFSDQAVAANLAKR
ncbi:MAG: hypothetical protein ACKPJJ_20540, partial [Planctomycetaceae bacterium]